MGRDDGLRLTRSLCYLNNKPLPLTSISKEEMTCLTYVHQTFDLSTGVPVTLGCMSAFSPQETVYSPILLTTSTINHQNIIIMTF